MLEVFVLSPRYYLDDEGWLEGVDPSRNYWLRVNGDSRVEAVIPGLIVPSLEELRTVIKKFRALQSGETLVIERIADSSTIYCIGNNCYAIETIIEEAPVWHLFDRETLETLLMTAHPDWIPSEKDVELGRRMLLKSLAQPVTSVKKA